MVPTTSNRTQGAGNSVTTSFPFGMLFYDPTHLFVYLTDSFGNNTLQTYIANYSVTGTGNSSGGAVVMIVPPPTGYTLTILRIVPLTQLQHYITNGDFPSAPTEQVLDLLVMMCQQQQTQLNRAIQTSQTENASVGMLPSALLRANGLLGFDPNGNPIVTVGGLGQPRGNYVPGMAYDSHDVITDPATFNVYQATKNYTSASITADVAAGNLVLVLNAVAIAAGITGSVTPIAAWSTGIAYSVGNIVYFTNNDLYRCATAHTSGVFATDLAAGKWVNLAPATTSPATYGTDSGTTNAYVVNPSPAPASLAAGLKAQFIPANTNNTAATLNFSGFGVQAIKKNGTTALIAGDLTAGVMANLQYDGTNWQLLNPPAVELLVGGKLPAVDGSNLTNISAGQYAVVTLPAGTTSWTVPAGVTQAKVTLIGGGGGGSIGGQCGSGGGGCVGFLTGLTPAASVACTVGSGGGGASATAGGSTTIGGFTATGGGAGGLGTSGTIGAAGSGSGGYLNASGTVPTVIANGSNGIAGNSAFASGIPGVKTTGAGTAGSGGAGGGGGGATNLGAAGGDGIIIIEY